VDSEKHNRREFLRRLALIAGAMAVAPEIVLPAEQKPSADVARSKVVGGNPDIVVVTGGKPQVNVRTAINRLGGMQRFVKRNDVVVVKPNIGWDRIAAQAADTNPDVVAEVVKMALEAGAKEVKVFDYSINNPAACYERSGIEQKAREAGAKVKFVDERFFKSMNFPGTHFIKQWPVYTEALEADCFINVPVAKHHSTAKLTMAMKNLMGVIGDNRGKLHQDIHVALAELATQLKPHLTVLDAFRIIVRNGPTGGSLQDVATPQKCIVGTNQVSVDAYGATLFNLRPEEVGYIKLANELGLGEINLSRLNIAEVSA
jgi:uncharacterized protein (DUF362 family)